MWSKDRVFVLKEIQAVIFIENFKVPQDHHALYVVRMFWEGLYGVRKLCHLVPVRVLCSHQ
jgi:hypothetical protein